MQSRHNNILKRKSNLIARAIEGEFIVFDTSNGMLYKLNETAILLWKSVSKPKRVEEIVEKIADKYHQDKKDVEQDVNDFLDKYSSIFFEEKR